MRSTPVTILKTALNIVRVKDTGTNFTNAGTKYTLVGRNCEKPHAGLR